MRPVLPIMEVYYQISIECIPVKCKRAIYRSLQNRRRRTSKRAKNYSDFLLRVDWNSDTDCTSVLTGRLCLFGGKSRRLSPVRAKRRALPRMAGRGSTHCLGQAIWSSRRIVPTSSKTLIRLTFGANAIGVLNTTWNCIKTQAYQP